jgi:hypothetical protein
MWFRAETLARHNTYALLCNETFLVDGFRAAIDYGVYGGSPPVVQVWTTESGGALFLRSSSTINARRWYHLAITYNGSTAKLYLDGVLVGTQTGTLGGNTNDIRFGTGIIGKRSLGGSLDDVRIYHKELTPSEVQNVLTSLTDGDSLPDAWERSFFGDLSKAPTDDSDSDSFDNLTEFNAGTNPNDGGDSNGNGFPDDWEAADSDEDGLTNGIDPDPYNPDFDGDGFWDGIDFDPEDNQVWLPPTDPNGTAPVITLTTPAGITLQ